MIDTVENSKITIKDGKKYAALSLATVEVYIQGDSGSYVDAVEGKRYNFSKNELRRIIGSLKILKSCNVFSQRSYEIGENKSIYVHPTENAFLWQNLEFDWEDLLIIDKLLSNG